jgi:PPM family protein phosphatase
VDPMSIGEFARRSRLSAKALRLYDELGLLPPARVDASSGYRERGATALGKEFVALLRAHPLPHLEGRGRVLHLIRSSP